MTKACGVRGCEREYYARGWCSAHYQRVADTGDVRAGDAVRQARVGCVIEGCERPHHSNGWCASHARRFVRHGDPLGGGPSRQRFSGPEERFWSKVDRSGGPDACWPWTAGQKRGGYGQIAWRIGDASWRPVIASRVAFFLENGDWPPAVLHACDNPPCCNPRHLSAGTQEDNMREARERGRLVSGEDGRFLPLT